MLRLAVKQIKQIDNHHFQIEWNDNTTVTYHLDKLQKNCPCAGCLDESTNTSKPIPVAEEVRAISIKSVGRYALKIQFTSGCSAGIYDFTLLRKLIKDKNEKPLRIEKDDFI